MDRKILIVDDTSQNLQVLKGIFEVGRYSLYFATSGESALEVLDATDVDLVLLDVRMPGMDGFETCRRIKAQSHSAHIPVIFLSADANFDSKMLGFEVGGVDYVTKPFVAEEVIARVNTQLNVIAAHDKLRELGDFKIKMLSMATHELNNELSIVSLNLAMGLKKVQNGDLDDAEHFLKVSQSSGKEMGQTLRKFITLASSSLNKVAPSLSYINMNEILDELSVGFEDKLNLNRIEVINEIGSEAVYSDKIFIKHILINLISNGLKYSFEDTIVNVVFSTSSDEFTICVANDGIGIPKVDRELIFEPFSRGSNVEKRKGCGVGLSLVKSFVDALCGSIAVSSEEGGKTIFEVTLPIKD